MECTHARQRLGLRRRSQRSLRFELGVVSAGVLQNQTHCPIESGDCADSVAAVQKLAPPSHVRRTRPPIEFPLKRNSSPR